MASYTPAATRTARRYGIPVPLFLTLVKWESGGRPGVVSPAGAIGYTQLMPATARGLGVDPWNPVQNLDGGARYLKAQFDKFGSWGLALAAYNAGPNAVAKYNGIPPFAETQRYVKGILAAAGNLGQPGAPLPGAPAAAPTTVTPPSQPAPPDLTGAAVGTLAHVAAHQFSPQESLAALTESVAQQRAVAPPVQQQTAAQPGTPATPKAPPGGWQKWVVLAKNADRSGATTRPAVLRFVARIAQAYGQPLTIGTGTNHNQYVINTHRESAHWTGRAADIPASGDELRRLGYLALVAAGWSRRKARDAAATGGLFNVGRYQIIFDTNIGGNHFNHLHVGVR